MRSMKIVHHCCRSITARHSSFCDLYTPTGRLKLSTFQADLLLRANAEDAEEGLRVNVNGHNGSAYALERRHLAHVRRCSDSCRVLLTDEGRRLASLLNAAKEST